MRFLIAFLLTSVLGIAHVQADEHGCPTYDQFYTDLGSSQFVPSLSGGTTWTFEIEIGGFQDGYVFTDKATVGCNIFGGSGCGLDQPNGKRSTDNYVITAPDGINPTGVPPSLLFKYKDCVEHTLYCDGHTEKIPLTYPPPSTAGGGILNLMVANCSSGPDKRELTAAEQDSIQTDLVNKQGECEADAQQQKGCD